MATTQFDQNTRPIGIATSLGENKLLLAGFSGQEELGRLYRFDLDLRSMDNAIKFEDMVGKSVTLRVNQPDGNRRLFSGFISRFQQVSTVTRDRVLAAYCAEMVPWLWFLTRTADCRIFQKKTIPDIVRQVCGDLGFTDIELRLSASYKPWEYCVQYRETDFNFVSRLMEEEGIYYFFQHGEKGKHTLVLCDSPGSHQPYAAYEKIRFRDFAAAAEIGEAIAGWTIEKEIQPGKYAHTDYNFTTPGTSLMDGEAMAQAHDKSDLEIYDFPGEYEDRGGAELYGKIRIQELQARYERHVGDTPSRGITVGGKFTLENHPRADQNKDYVVTSARYAAHTGAYDGRDDADTYDCRFIAIDAAKQFRSARITPKPIVQGPQTAEVVGPHGEEIHTDEYARVKVQFHWDREGRKDENSSCWIRVSQPWAGKDWGAQATPRIGQEVIVSFYEGDPDRPVITGRVYNAAQMPPYGGGKGVVSGMKSKTHKGGGSNEMSMDDTAGREKITIIAQYDMNTTVGNNQTTKVGNNRTDMIGVDDSETVGSNQSASVGANQTVNVGVIQNVTVDGDQKIEVGSSQAISIGAIVLTVITGESKTTIDAAETQNIGAIHFGMIKGDRTTDVSADNSLIVSAAHVMKAGGEVTIESSASVGIEAPLIVLKAQGAKIIMTPAGIKITGPTVSYAGGLIKNNE